MPSSPEGSPPKIKAKGEKRRRDKVNKNTNGHRLGRYFLIVWLLFGSFWGHSGGHFQCFSELWGLLGPSEASLGPKGGSWTPLWRQARISVVLGLAGGRHFEAKGCPRDPQGRQKSPKGEPKGSKRGPKR